MSVGNGTIEELRGENEQLRQQLDELRGRLEEHGRHRPAAEAHQANREFLAGISHEIRTPMTSILGYTELLMRDGLTEQQRASYLEIVRRNGEALLQLLNDILDLSKIEAGGLHVQHVDFAPCQLVEDVIALLRGRAEDKGLALLATYEWPLPERVHCDPLRLQQILVNLLGNAIQFTERGEVRLTLRMGRGPDQRPRLVFAVTDTGIGIGGDEIPLLFQPRPKGDTLTAGHHGGAGLGLAVSRRLAEMLGGTIEVSSRVGAGSTFTLSIDPGPLDGVRMLTAVPLAPARTAPASSDHERPRRGRLLVAEDGRDSRHLLRVVLERAGLQIDLAENGLVACNLVAAAAAAGNPYDLILMDLQMPELDGFQAMQKLRRSGWAGPIVALTAHAMPADRERCLSAGFDDYLAKPLDRAKLLQLVQRYLEQDSAPRAPELEPARASGLLDDPRISPSDRARILAGFVERLEQRAGQIERAIDEADRLTLLESAHSLHGSAGLFGFAQLADAARNVEEQVRTEADADPLFHSAANLVRLCRQTAANAPT